ncbi:MAG: HEAT repeat domain-containing protein [Desulfatiglandales bacterium]|nr:HEAT repeat domain-containing protein [Desulfatiglandales bacterium]
MKFHPTSLIFSMVGFIFIIQSFGSFVPPSFAGDSKKDYLLDRALAAIAAKRDDLSMSRDLFTHPFTLSRFSRWMENPLEAPSEAQQKIRNLFEVADRPVLWFQELAELGDISSPGPLPLKKNIDWHIPTQLPIPLRKAIHLILDAMHAAEAKFSAIKKGLSPEKMRQFEKYLYPDFCREGDSEDHKNDWIKIKELRETIDAAEGVDRKGILEAGLTLIKALSEARGLLTEIGDWGKNVPSISFETELGLVEIGSTDPENHEKPSTLIIDLGGNDIYRGKIAYGTHGKGSVVLDLSGDDVYLGEDFTQASGIWGIGVLFDLRGNDIYRAGNCSQGAGLFGVGLLMDEGGMDSYTGAKFVQAASAWGWGGLIDLAGEDSYQIQHSGQAYSGVLGVSALFDIIGDDKYISGAREPDPREPDMNQSFSQGFAFGMRNLTGGGFALLADQSGNDLYQCQYFGQGSSYWMAIGILYDEGGKDTYIARRYAQGTGIHYSFGLLMDSGGNDHTFSWGVSQGGGHDYGIGLLINEAGNDTYASSWLSMGASEANGVGIFIDNSGDDGYETKTGMAVGRLILGRRAGGIGLFIDAGGKDRYSIKGADNSIWGLNRWGIGIDAEEKGVSGLNLLPPEPSFYKNEEAEKKRIKEKTRLSGILAKSERMPFPLGIEGMLSVASHWGFEREIPENAGEELLKLEPEKSVPGLITFLNTHDVLSLRFMEKFFTVHAVHAVRALIQKTTDPDPLVRSRAFYFLGRIKDPRALAYCVEALKNSSWKVKASAIRALGEILNEKRLDVLIPMKEAFDEAMKKKDHDIIRDYLEDDNKIMAVLSVLARAMPLDYGAYMQYAEIRIGEEEKNVLAEYADFVFGHLKEMIPLLERWIGDINSSEVVAKELMAYLNDSNPAVKRAIAYSLGQMNYLPAIPQLLSLLKDPDLWVRDAAALSLALFDDEAIPPLDLAMQHEPSSFKIIALDILARIKDEETGAVIEKYLDDPHQNVKRAAEQALRKNNFPD